MKNRTNKKIDWVLILPASLLLIETIIVVVLLAAGYEINQLMMFIFILLAGFLAFQTWRQISLRLHVKKAVKKIDKGKKLVDLGRTFEAIDLWKNIIPSLPRDKYLDVLNLLEEAYQDQEMNAGVQQVKAIRSESLNFFQMTKDPRKATIKDRKDWQARALEIRKMINALPTEPGQDLSESLDE